MGVGECKAIFIDYIKAIHQCSRLHSGLKRSPNREGIMDPAGFEPAAFRLWAPFQLGYESTAICSPQCAPAWKRLTQSPRLLRTMPCSSTWDPSCAHSTMFLLSAFEGLFADAKGFAGLCHGLAYAMGHIRDKELVDDPFGAAMPSGPSTFLPYLILSLQLDQVQWQPFLN